MLVQAIVGKVSRLPSSSFKLMGAYQHQPIGTRVHLGVLCDVPIRHPRTNDVEQTRLHPLQQRQPRKPRQRPQPLQPLQQPRSFDDGEHVGMRSGLALTRETLVWSALSTPLIFL